MMKVYGVRRRSIALGAVRLATPRQYGFSGKQIVYENEALLIKGGPGPGPGSGQICCTHATNLHASVAGRRRCHFK